MPVKQPKKLLILNILDILRKYSDEEHRLSQKDIAEILKTEYDMTADRKAIRRNILNLMDCGYNIEYSESIRMVPNPKTGVPEESYLWSDFYLERDFTDGELRLLIDSLLFSKHIPYSQCKELVGKLEGLSNVYFRSRVKHIARLRRTKPTTSSSFSPSSCWTRPSAGGGRSASSTWSMERTSGSIARPATTAQSGCTSSLLTKWQPRRGNIT